MICPHCGELAPPGPLDVRNCAPRLSARSDTSLTMLSRVLRWLLARRQRMRNLLPASAQRAAVAREHSTRAFVNLRRRARPNSREA